jgi:co-chaperonin GroES (HSP10)
MILPTKGNLYVKRTGKDETVTAAGIVIPDAINSKLAHDRVLIYAVVETVGEGVTQAKAGDTVVFPRYEAWPLNEKKSKDDDEFIVAEKFIYAIIHT